MPGAFPAPIHRRRRLWFPAALAVFCLLAPQDALPAQARGAKHADYARIVFDQDEAGGFSANLDGQKLIVRFDQPFKGDPKTLLSSLDGIVSSAGMDGARKTATLTLRQGNGCGPHPHRRSRRLQPPGFRLAAIGGL